MFNIKTDFNKANANDLYNFIVGVTSGNAVQIKIEKGWFDNFIVYRADVAYPEWSNSFEWDREEVPYLNITGADAVVATVKALLETGTVIVWVDNEGAAKEPSKRYFTVEYFEKGSKINIVKESY